MYIINSDTDNPYFNLAVEEYLLKQRTEEFFILSINDTSVVAGKHQCIHREINTRFITGNNIPVLRRITGGGTVFHDHGNLNFCFIRNCEAGKQVDFQRHLLPVTGFLSTFDVKATIQGSDIIVDGLKISGNAEHVFRNRVLHHGTILWKASLDNLNNCIRKDISAYETRAVASRPSMVMNLSEKIKRVEHINLFRCDMLNYFLRTIPGASLYYFNNDEKSEIEILSGKYRTWEWNYAYGPDYEFRNKFKLNGKNVSFSLSVKDGLIKECLIEGDPEMKEIGKELAGSRHMPEDILSLLKKNSLDNIDVFLFF